MSPTAYTIVLIHGLWLSSQSLERFAEYYRSRGYNVLVPEWPRFGETVGQTCQRGRSIAELGTAEIFEHYERLLEKLDTPVLLIGHSFGGLLVQLLLDRGWGSAGVAIAAPAAPGVWRYTFVQLRMIAPVLLNPFNDGRSVSLSSNRFRSVVANAVDDDEAAELFDRYVVPAPARVLFELAFSNLTPRSPLYVNYCNHKRAPLLLVSGSDDHLVPNTITRRVLHRHACSNSVTDFKEFSGRSHLLIAERGWEEVASYTLAWAFSQTKRRNDYRLSDSNQHSPATPPSHDSE
ncbi:Phospholipase YtpA [Stieleria maiorica]|uniref:Phospholipase YtpA n=1 Tax=Stieleria maiorica TaxID=2795974 RepID=A0A5B9MN01_9BACT|nr:alpha/beta fold hydrolase [Stieleria maiorica]QEG01780.1 Phospholipase YtpA [Stieleria maiorica]